MQAGGVAKAGPPAKRKKAAEAKKLYARDTAQVRAGRKTCEPPCLVAGRARQHVDEGEPRASKFTLGDLSRSSARAGGWLAARRKRGGRAQVTRRRRPHRHTYRPGQEPPTCPPAGVRKRDPEPVRGPRATDVEAVGGGHGD